MAQHTPGPWELHAEPGGIRICKADHSAHGCFLVAEAEILHIERSVAEANARLIAAAPALLEALGELLRVGRDQDVVVKARAVIAQGEGGDR